MYQIIKIKPVIVSMGNVAASGGFWISQSAAALLGVSVRTLFYRLRQLGIARRPSRKRPRRSTTNEHVHLFSGQAPARVDHALKSGGRLFCS